jgi:hypothetical protein
MNLEFNPRSAQTYALIGFAYTRKADDASAIVNLEKSLGLDPAGGAARGNKVQVCRQPAKSLRDVSESASANLPNSIFLRA